MNYVNQEDLSGGDDDFVSSRIRYTDDSQTQRQGHLMALLPLSRPNRETGERDLQEFRVYVELSAFLAFRHIQNRSGEVLPELPNILEQCDFTWTYRHHDTQFSPLQAAREVMSYELPQGSRQAQPWKGPPTPAPASSNANENENADGAWNDYWSLPVVEQVQEVTAAGEAESDEQHHNEYWSVPPVPAPTEPQQQQSSFEAPREGPFGDASSSSTTTTATFQAQAIVQDTRRTPAPIPPATTTTTRPQRTAVPLRTESPWTTSVAARGDGNVGLRRRRRREEQVQDDQDPQQQEPERQKPFAILGAARSVTSQAVGILGSAFELPQISSSSTASSLDALPFFGRTVPTNEGDAHATIVYLSQQLGVTHIGVLHSEDSWGRRYEQDLQFYGKRYGVDVKSVAYTIDTLDQAMVQLEESNLRYFVGIINSGAWKPVVRAAYNHGLMGNPDNQWYIGDLVELVGDGFALERETERDIALALHGVGVIFLQVTPHVAFDRALAAVADNPALQQEFIASHDYPELLQNFTFSSTPGMSLFQYLTYDAIISLGITACNTPGLFTGKEFYQQLLQVDFEGVSGRVNLNNDTGTRLGDSLRYQIVNMVLDDYLVEEENGSSTSSSASDPTVMTFSANVTSTVELSPPNGTGPMVHAVQPFVYHDNTTTPPMALPYHEENMNLIPNGVRGFGISLSLLGMLLSLAIGIWVVWKRNIYVIRASQPVFLVQLCVGTFLLAATILPLGAQEPAPKLALDVACNAVPWLWSLGVATSISAIFSKTHRINRLMNTTGSGFRRVQIKPRDVMKPTLILLAINLVLLTGWSASPARMTWHRITVENHVDQFGRSAESYGVCRPNSIYHFFFTTPLVLANTIVLGLTTYQSYVARDLPSEFSETAYMALSMISLSETFVLGVMIVFPVLDQPTAFYLLSSILFFVGCMSILLPMFLPKFAQRNTRAPRGRNATSVAIRRNTTTAFGRSAYMSNLDGSGGFGAGSGSGSRFLAGGSGGRNGSSNFVRYGAPGDGLNTGTYHGSSRNDVSPFGGGSSLSLRNSSSEHGRRISRGRGGTLSTTPEERDSSDSFG